MANRKVLPFFCDECGIDLSTGYVCPECKRVLCCDHYYGNFRGAWGGPVRRKDGLCVKCAEDKRLSDEKTKQA